MVVHDCEKTTELAALGATVALDPKHWQKLLRGYCHAFRAMLR
jgi:putative sterol carrier protein